MANTTCKQPKSGNPPIPLALVESSGILQQLPAETGRLVLFPRSPRMRQTHLAVDLATLAVEAGFRGYVMNRNVATSSTRRRSTAGWKAKSNWSIVLRTGNRANRIRAERRRLRVASACSPTRRARNSICAAHHQPPAQRTARSVRWWCRRPLRGPSPATSCGQSARRQRRSSSTGVMWHTARRVPGPIELADSSSGEVQSTEALTLYRPCA